MKNRCLGQEQAVLQQKFHFQPEREAHYWRFRLSVKYFVYRRAFHLHLAVVYQPGSRWQQVPVAQPDCSALQSVLLKGRLYIAPFGPDDSIKQECPFQYFQKLFLLRRVED